MAILDTAAHLTLPKVLLIEDNPVDARFVSGLLQAQSPQLECRHVSSLAEALPLLEAETFDAVLLDLNLEDSTGYETFAAVHRAAAAAASILVLSGSDDEELAIRTVREGAQDYLVKGSFDGGLLLRSLRYAVERKHSEEALRKSEATVRAVFEGSLDGIVIMEDHGICLEANSAAVAMFCCAREELVGRNILEFFGKDFSAEWMRLRVSGSGRGQFWVLCPAGANRLLDCSFKTNILSGQHLAVLRDITDQHNLEEQLRQSQKMEAVGRLAGGVAHDFNNILGVISGHAELMQLQAIAPEQRSKAAKILAATDKASSLTRQLLAFGRRQVVTPELIDLRDVLGELNTMISSLMGAETQVVLRARDPLGLVRADQSQLEQVILNLTTNAREAMPHGGTMTIALENHTTGSDDAELPQGEYVRLSISDTGCGIPAELVPQIFEPFFTTKKTGSGLGLSTVYGIVKQSGGFVTLQSAPGQGATFKVYLPRVLDEVPRPVRGEEAAPAHFDGSETILVVDDEDELRDAVAEYLEGRGYNVFRAKNGQEAVLLAEKWQRKISLLISDVIMPKMSGRMLVDYMRKSRPETAVLVISGYADDETLRRGLIKTASFLQKPFTLQMLGAKVRELLDERKVGR
ncbi:MAG TPA: response regulator [Candidatus Angelobacter sp.]